MKKSEKMNPSTPKRNARGALINGTWYCDCDPKLVAEHHQTKNGGQNHGRWFYTCQKAQHKRCKFFLWDDDARLRDNSTVIDKNQPQGGVETLSKPAQPLGAAMGRQSSPQAQKSRSSVVASTGNRRLSDSSSSYDYGLSPAHEEAFIEAARRARMAPPETPRKTPRTSVFVSPGKRNRTDALEDRSSVRVSTDLDDVFLTPSTSDRATGLPSPAETPARGRHDIFGLSTTTSSLAADAISILDKGKLPVQIEKELIELLTKHELRSQGIARGRDITRLALVKKEKRIAELEAKVQTLEAEQETSKAVIAHLKRDMAEASPIKGRKRGS